MATVVVPLAERISTARAEARRAHTKGDTVLEARWMARVDELLDKMLAARQ